MKDIPHKPRKNVTFPKVHKLPKSHMDGKYDSLLLENINPGRNYKDYLLEGRTKEQVRRILHPRGEIKIKTKNLPKEDW